MVWWKWTKRRYSTFCDTKNYPEPNEADPIIIDNHPQIWSFPQQKPIQYSLPMQYQYIFWILAVIITINCVCLTVYFWNKNKEFGKSAKAYSKMSSIDAEESEDV